MQLLFTSILKLRRRTSSAKLIELLKDVEACCRLGKEGAPRLLGIAEISLQVSVCREDEVIRLVVLKVEFKTGRLKFFSRLSSLCHLGSILAIVVAPSLRRGAEGREEKSTSLNIDDPVLCCNIARFL